MSEEYLEKKNDDVYLIKMQVDVQSARREKCHILFYHLMFMELENVMMYIRVAPVNMPMFCNNKPMYAEVLLSVMFSSIILFISGVLKT